MGPRTANSLSETLGALALGAGLLLAYWSLSQAYPYYFLWDMDLVCAQDSLLINSGLLPDHIHHTGFGMYLLLAWAQRLGAALGLVSALDLGQLSASLNPLAPLAEFIDYLRRLSPLAGLALVLLLWASLKTLLRPRALGSLLALAALGLLPGLLYQTAMVRTETYALLFWAGATLALVCAARAGAWGRALGVGLGGLLLGLCLLTKVQSGLYVAAAPLFYLISDALAPEGPDRAWGRPGGGRGLALVLALAGLGAAILLIARALPLPVPSGMGAFMEHYKVGLSARALLLPAAFLLLAALLVWNAPGRKQWRPWLNGAALAAWLGFGFVFSLGLHFLLYTDPATSWRYLLLDFKMAFLRSGFGFSDLWSRVELLAFCWPTLALHATSWGLLAWVARRRLNPGLSRLCWLVLLASGLAYLSILTTDRFILRDLLWVELLLSFLALVCLLALARYQAHARAWRGAALVLAGLMAAVNLGGALQIPARLDANYNLYGWLPQRSLGGVFGHNQRRFDQLFRAAYAGQPSLDQVVWGPLGGQATHHTAVRSALDFVFCNLKLNLRQAGALLPGQPLWLAHPDSRLREAPPALAGALVVDTSAVAPRDSGFWRPALVREVSERLDKQGPQPMRPSLAVLPRPDLRVYLFVEPKQWQRLSGPGLERLPREQAPCLMVKGPEGQLTLWGLEISLYQELPLAALGPRYLFVLQSRLAPWGGAPPASR